VPVEIIRAVEVLECTCLRCGHKWRTTKPTPPKRCTRCNSPYWNVPRGVLKRGRPKAGEETRINEEATKQKKINELERRIKRLEDIFGGELNIDEFRRFVDDMPHLFKLADKFRMSLSRLCLRFPKLAAELGIAVDGLPEIIPKVIGPDRFPCGGLSGTILEILNKGPSKYTRDLIIETRGVYGSILHTCKKLEAKGLISSEKIRGPTGRYERIWRVKPIEKGGSGDEKRE